MFNKALTKHNFIIVYSRWACSWNKKWGSWSSCRVSSELSHKWRGGYFAAWGLFWCSAATSCQKNKLQPKLHRTNWPQREKTPLSWGIWMIESAVTGSCSKATTILQTIIGQKRIRSPKKFSHYPLTPLLLMKRLAKVCSPAKHFWSFTKQNSAEALSLLTEADGDVFTKSNWEAKNKMAPYS